MKYLFKNFKIFFSFLCSLTLFLILHFIIDHKLTESSMARIYLAEDIKAKNHVSLGTIFQSNMFNKNLIHCLLKKNIHFNDYKKLDTFYDFYEFRFDNKHINEVQNCFENLKVFFNQRIKNYHEAIKTIESQNLKEPLSNLDILIFIDDLSKFNFERKANILDLQIIKLNNNFSKLKYNFGKFFLSITFGLLIYVIMKKIRFN